MFHPSGFPLSLALGLLANRVVAAPTLATRSDASISWGSCENFSANSTDPNLQCGYLEVPMDYHDSSAGNARLAVIKLTATKNKLGTVFFNSGGPGGSGIQFIANNAQTITNYSSGGIDVVSWDPRGVGYTSPGELHCFNSTKEDIHFWEHTLFNFINETISGGFDDQDFNELYSKANLTDQKFQDFMTHCQNSPSGKYLKYVGTSSTVRDLVSLGDAIVGQGQPIDFWGVSYGTVIGFNFINMFPERAGHVVLDGVVDPTAWITYQLAGSSLADTDKTCSDLGESCAKVGKAGCKLIEITGDNASGDDVTVLLNNVHNVALELYRSGYLKHPPAILSACSFNPPHTSLDWSPAVNEELYPTLVGVLQIAQAHNVTVLGGRQYNVPSDNVTDSTLQYYINNKRRSASYSFAAVTGADDSRDKKTTIKDISDAIVETTRKVTTFGTLFNYVHLAYGWPVRSVEQLPPYTPVKLKNQVLVIGNTADPITPFASAEHAASLLGDNAFLLEQLGFGHSSLAQPSSCTRSIINNYFANGTLPQGGSTQCAVDDIGLFPPLNGTTTTSRRSNSVRRWR